MTRTYLMECYWPGVTEQAYAETAARASHAARALQGSGHDVRFLDSLLMLADETVFYRFAGASAADVEEVCTRAGLQVGRIVEYVTAADASGESHPGWGVE